MPDSSRFLQELREQLDGRLPPATNQAIYEEFASDIAHRLQAYEEIGIERPEAELATERALGDPKQVARNLVLAHLADYRPKWASAALVLLSATAFTYPWLVWVNHPGGPFLANSVFAVLFAAYGLLAVVAGRFPIRPLATTVFCSAAVCWVLLSTVFVVHFSGKSRVVYPPGAIEAKVERLESEVDWLRASLGGKPLPQTPELYKLAAFERSRLPQVLEHKRHELAKLKSYRDSSAPLAGRLFAPVVLLFAAVVYGTCALLSACAWLVRGCFREILWRVRRFPRSIRAV